MKQSSPLQALVFVTLVLGQAMITGCSVADRFLRPEPVAAAQPAGPASDEAKQAPVKLDPYGGLLSMPSSGPTTKAFRLEKFFNKKWMFVDPDNNAFFMTGMYLLDQSESRDEHGASYAAISATKYGDTGPSWAPAQLRRLQSWGFNTVGPFASLYALATHSYSGWPEDHANPAKVPFIAFFRPSYYAMTNQNKWADQPVKNMLAGVGQSYSGYRPYDGIADYDDPNWEHFLANELANDGAEIKKSPYKRYMVGVSLDDSDDLFGFGAGPDFTTAPQKGNNNAHLGWLVLVMSPFQTASAQYSKVYSDTAVYSKKELREQLASKYGTIGALNAAWGSNYTTFDSSGAAITGEPIGVGDGATATFSSTLHKSVVSAFSLQIFVSGAAVGGDLGNGTLWGPNLSGTINYSTGALNLTFRNAPQKGAAVTTSYVQNGWGIGSGLMDEDGRPSHQSWVGKDYVRMTDVNSGLKTDLDAFLYEIANHYFSTGRTRVEQWMPHVLFMGPSTLGTWSIPSNRNVLKAAGESLDVMVIGGGWPLSQPELDFIYQYFGDKPIYVGAYRTANSDSAMSRYPASAGDFRSQHDRGRDYYDATLALATAAYSNGSRPYVGVVWWQYLDNRGEKLNWGLVSLSDNSYDGHEDVASFVACSAPLSNYRCGGEDRNYGDVITSVENAHQSLFRILPR